jgi:hypothetical protein
MPDSFGRPPSDQRAAAANLLALQIERHPRGGAQPQYHPLHRPGQLLPVQFAGDLHSHQHISNQSKAGKIAHLLALHYEPGLMQIWLQPWRSQKEVVDEMMSRMKAMNGRPFWCLGTHPKIAFKRDSTIIDKEGEVQHLDSSTIMYPLSCVRIVIKIVRPMKVFTSANFTFNLKA